jgi:hypothetical protein
MQQRRGNFTCADEMSNASMHEAGDGSDWSAHQSVSDCRRGLQDSCVRGSRSESNGSHADRSPKGWHRWAREIVHDGEGQTSGLQ